MDLKEGRKLRARREAQNQPLRNLSIQQSSKEGCGFKGERDEVDRKVGGKKMEEHCITGTFKKKKWM